MDLGPGDAGPDSSLDLGPDVGPDLGGDGGCEPVADDPAGIGDNCEGPTGEPDDRACLAGYECIPFAAFVSTFTCEIRCTKTCECPPPSICGRRCDNAGCIDACVH